MKCKALFGLRLLLGLLLFSAGSSPGGGADVVIEQIKAIGPRQWLGLMAGVIASSAPVIAPVAQRITRGFPDRSDRFASEEIAGRKGA